MKRYTIWMLLLIAVVSCAPSEDKMVMGKWKLMTRGVNANQQPCMFIPDEMELFTDGTISMSIMPPNARMFYKTAVTRDEKKALAAKNPSLKTGEHILLMKVTSNGDWTNSAVAYNYTADENKLSLEMPGWTPSVYGHFR